jgi:hypothetical protein
LIANLRDSGGRPAAEDANFQSATLGPYRII